MESPRGERFRLNFEGGHARIFSRKSIFMADLLKARSLAGVKAFIVDLELDPRPLATARTIFDAIHRKKPIKNTSRMNYQRGLF